jgi:hypothetical protein
MLKQCLPITKEYFPDYSPIRNNILKLLVYFFAYTLSSTTHLLVALLTIISLFFLINQELKKNMEIKNEKNILSFLICLIVFIIFNLGEFLASGTDFRMIWAMPLCVLFISMLLSYITKNLNTLIKFFIYSTLSLVIFLNIFRQHQEIQILKQTENFLPYKKAKIYTKNPPDWKYTVQSTVKYLEKNLEKNETFLALPYDILYYFLLNRTSPFWQITFFEGNHISKDQERMMIDQLEQKRINYVLISNRIYSKEAGLGEFGRTHCVLLGQYITKNFTTVKTFGDWTKEPGWVSNHAVKILKRVQK